VAHTFEELVNLERSAVQAHVALDAADDTSAARTAWVKAAAAFQAAVTDYAETSGESRVEVEMRVKKAVRHADAAEG